MLDRTHIGVAFGPTSYDVEAGAIRRFAEAIGDSNQIHHDSAYAAAAGFSGLVAPPTFPVTFHFDSSKLGGLDLTKRGVLLGEQTFEYERPIVAGDRISVIRRVDEIGDGDAASNAMGFFSILEEGTDAAGKLVYRARRVLIVRGSS